MASMRGQQKQDDQLQPSPRQACNGHHQEPSGHHRLRTPCLGSTRSVPGSAASQETSSGLVAHSSANIRQDACMSETISTCYQMSRSTAAARLRIHYQQGVSVAVYTNTVYTSLLPARSVSCSLYQYSLYQSITSKECQCSLYQYSLYQYSLYQSITSKECQLQSIPIQSIPIQFIPV